MLRNGKESQFLMNIRNLKLTCAALAGLAVFGAGVMVGANKFNKPKSVVHVITLKFKDGTTAEQKTALMAATDKLAGDFNGLKNVWTNKMKVQGFPQGADTGLIVMEFADKAAFDRYTNDPAHKAWEAVYMPLLDRSVTHDATN